MKKVLTLNKISPLAKQTLGENYFLSDSVPDPDCILVRSFAMHEYNLPSSVVAVVRCGAGVNNIPCDKYAEQGVLVYNTPGANSNAVKELTLSALFSCGRKLAEGIAWSKTLTDGDKTVSEQVEKGKSAFVGHEIIGKTLGMIGLGNIGKKVAEVAMVLGMKVLFTEVRDVSSDPDFPKGAVQTDIDTLCKESDFITLHIPYLPSTRGTVNAALIAKMKDGVSIINTARGELVIDEDIIAALISGKVNRYVTDFPNSRIIGAPNVVATPHIGASTYEAEENCASIGAKQLLRLFDDLDVVNSVNFPNLTLPCKGYPVLVLFSGSGEQFAQEGKSWRLHDYAIKSNGKYGVAKFDFVEKPNLALFDNIPHLRILTK